MRGNVRIESITGRDVSDAGDFGQLVGSLEILGNRLYGQVFEGINGIPINPQVGSHSRLQYPVSLTLESFLWLHGSMVILDGHFCFVARPLRFIGGRRKRLQVIRLNCG